MKFVSLAILTAALAAAQCTVAINPLTGRLECGGAGTSVTQLDNYTQEFTAQTSVALAHNAGTRSVVVQCFDADNKTVSPQDVELTSTTVATVTFATSTQGDRKGRPANPAGRPNTFRLS